MSLERTVEAVGAGATSGQREVSRTVERAVDAAPAGARVVEAVTEQVDRTTDAAVGSATAVARTVDVTVTKPVVRPVLRPLLGSDAPAGVPSDHDGQARSSVGDQQALVHERPRTAPALDAPRQVRPAPSLSLPDAAADAVLVTATGPVLDDVPSAFPDDVQRDVGDGAGATASAEGGPGALAVLDGRARACDDRASVPVVPRRDAPRGPSFGPSFRPD